MKKRWRLRARGSDSNCFLFGVNIFNRNWNLTDEKAYVVDPIYKQTRTFSVYTTKVRGNMRKFAAGEFSNNYWGFYVLSYLPF